MKKTIFSLFLIIAIVIAVAVYYLLGNMDSLVKAGIEKYGSAAIQTSVRVKDVKIKLSEGASTIKGLTIANPLGFDTPYAISLGEVTLGVDLNSLNGEPYIINEILVRAPQVFVEMNENKKTNINKLMNNITGGKKNIKIKPVTTAANDDKATSKAPRLIVRKLIFSDGTIQVKLKPLNNKEYKLKLSSLIMKDLGGKDGVTPTELTKEIINRLLDQAKKDVKEKGIDVELGKLKAKVNNKIQEQRAKFKADTDKKITGEKLKLENKLKNFLK